MLTKHYHAFILLYHILALHTLALALAINLFHEKIMAIILSRPEPALWMGDQRWLNAGTHYTKGHESRTQQDNIDTYV